jgi:hypothetical protein
MPRILTAAAIILLMISPGFGGTESKIKIDPALFIYLKECRTIAGGVGNEIWKGWDFTKTPVLFYRPHVQDILISYPHKPDGFLELTGFNPLDGETIFYRDGTTFINDDGQNTVTDIDGVKTLVVADTFSNQRSQLNGVLLGRDKDFAQKWLENWNFIPGDPYSQMAMILHEGFHAFQDARAPNKSPNEMAGVDYPLLDTPNNVFWALEAALVRDALLSDSPDSRAAKIRELVAIRTERRAGLDKPSVEYEDLAEYLEGLAKYVEFRFLKEVRGLEPDPRLFFVNGFAGFGPGLEEIRRKNVEQMKDIIAASIDMTGNKFGVGPLRFRLYSSGAALALLLDEVAPDWKADIFKDGVYLFDQLKKAVFLTEPERAALVSRAKAEYGYEALVAEKRRFAEEGGKFLAEKLTSILETRDTLVVIDYSDLGGITGMSFTPFGVSKVAEGLTIYDMVPLMARFANRAELHLTKIIPVLVDKAAKQMKFVVATKPSDIEARKGDGLKTDEFSLTGSCWEAKKDGNKVLVKLLKEARKPLGTEP